MKKISSPKSVGAGSVEMISIDSDSIDSDSIDLDSISSDESLVLLARAGDRSAFAELWQRHARSGLQIARHFTSSIDPEDLVSEAYVSIYQRVLAGGGPDGAFRPYLYTTIRNLASRWGQSRRDVNVDDIGDFEDPAIDDDPATSALDKTLTAQAFRSLPERWQSVLWYTEVEGMDPHEVAPILGISANSVAALSYRAREGLRKAWLQAHISDATSSGECQWSIARIGDYARNGLTPRERTRVSDHLLTCSKCSIISEEVDEVGSRLAFVMLPLLLGGAVGGAFLASLSVPSTAMAASIVPLMPPAFAALGSAGVGAAVVPTAIGLGAVAVSTPFVGVMAAALIVSGTLAVSAPVVLPTTTSASSVSAGTTSAPGTAAGSTPATASASGSSAGSISGLSDGSSPTAPGATGQPAADGSSGESTPGTGASIGGLITDLTNPGNALLDPPVSLPPITLPPVKTPPVKLPPVTIPPVTISPVTVPPVVVLPPVTVPPVVVIPPVVVLPATGVLDLLGTGTPGATVTLRSGSTNLATTTISILGNWTFHIADLSASVTSLELKQNSSGGIAAKLPLIVLTNSLSLPVTLES